MKSFKATVEKGVTEKGFTIVEVVEIEANKIQDAKYSLQKKYNLHHSQVSVLSSKFQKQTLSELKEIFDTKEEKRGGKRERAGAKPKYTEPTKTIAFRVPISKIDEVKEVIKSLLLSFTQNTP